MIEIPKVAQPEKRFEELVARFESTVQLLTEARMQYTLVREQLVAIAADGALARAIDNACDLIKTHDDARAVRTKTGKQ